MVRRVVVAIVMLLRIYDIVLLIVMSRVKRVMLFVTFIVPVRIVDVLDGILRLEVSMVSTKSFLMGDFKLNNTYRWLRLQSIAWRMSSTARTHRDIKSASWSTIRGRWCIFELIALI